MAIESYHLETVSRHGTAIQQLFRHDPPGFGGLAVLFPGQAYSCQRPLLHYARIAALEAGYDVLCLEYGFQASRSDGPNGDFETLRTEAVQAIDWALSEIGSVQSVVLIAKSIGTLVAAQVLHSTELPPVRPLLLTPVERAASLVGEHDAQAVIGTADQFYDRPGIQQSIAAHPSSWHVIAGLDHSLERPGDIHASLEGLSTAVAVMRSFLSQA